MSGRTKFLAAILIFAIVVYLGNRLKVGNLLGYFLPSTLIPLAKGDDVDVDLDKLEVVELRLDLLSRVDKKSSPNIGRDPWRYGQIVSRIDTPPPPPPKPKKVEPPKVVEKEDEGPRLPSLSGISFLGSFGPDYKRVAVFKFGDGTLEIVPEGDTFGREFIVRRVDYEWVEIGFVNFPNAPTRKIFVGG